MDTPSKRTRHNKSGKGGRKSRPSPLHPIVSGEISSQFSRSSVSHDPNRLNDIIDDMTSEGDDVRPAHRRETHQNLVEPDSPIANENHQSPFALPTIFSLPRTKKTAEDKRRLSRLKDRKNDSPSRKNTHDDEIDLMHRRKSLGDNRRDQLTECMEYYRTCLESAQNNYTGGMSENSPIADQRRQYFTAIWYELKHFFHGVHPSDESGLKMEQHSIEQQRKQLLNEFYCDFTRYDFENFFSHQHHLELEPIQRRHLSENHLNFCHEVDKSIDNFLYRWEQILSLFPSQLALEEFDKRFDSRTKDGRMFYEKLSVFQAWFNLHSEVNRLIVVLGRIMACTPCQTWPVVSSSSNPRLYESVSVNASRPPTPSSTSSSEVKETIVGSPSNTPFHLQTQQSLRQQHSRISANSDLNARRHPIGSISSVDNLYQTLVSTVSLTEFYYRYIDDQLTHARIELIASIFRSKHGPLLQRLRYIFRKDQTTMVNTSTTNLPTPFESVFKYHPFSPVTMVPSDYLTDAKPDRLMDEFLTLNKQLQQLKNPKLINQKKKNRSTRNPDQVINILGRFEQNPTLTSSTFPPASAPTLVLRILSHDRSIIKRQSYFLDYLDPTLFPHLPGSTLFPDPCTFIENLPFNFHTQSNPEEMLLIGKMLNISFRLYDRPVWSETGKFSDMFELFHLPSLYSQYVFLVQIPLDLMLAWQKYHQDRKMEPTSTKGALLLLIDECKILIHSAILIRQYVKTMTIDVFEKSEFSLIEEDLSQFDRNIIATIEEIIGYIERCVEISLRSNLFHHSISLLKEQWKSLKQYSTIMNIEETLAERFLLMYSTVINRFCDYIDVFHTLNIPSGMNKTDYIKKKMQKKYQKKLTMDILREARATYDDCALTINIYLQKPVCRRFLLILKTAGFERIKFETEVKSNKENSSTCLLFAPAEYFEDNATKLQLARTLSSSFRLSNNTSSSSELNDDSSSGPSQQQSPTSTQQPTSSTNENSPPLVYVLCVPISSELEGEWRGVTHTVASNRTLNSMLPLNSNWKTTTIFLLTQQATDLEKFEESFRERLSKTNVQQNDLYHFDTKSGQNLPRRSCFEKVDHAMNTLAHSTLSLSERISSNVISFEKLIAELETKDRTQMVKFNTGIYVHTEERAFAFAMDLIRETSFYATQLDQTTLKSQAERQIDFANNWLSFVRKKKSFSNPSKYPSALPMWLLPGVHFLRHICSLHFTTFVDNELFEKFYEKMQNTFYYLYHSNETSERKLSNTSHVRSRKPSQFSSTAKHLSKKRKAEIRLTRIEQLDLLDKRIDRRRFSEGLIGRIKQYDKSTVKMPTISKRMEQELAYMKIRNFHKLNLLSRGQFATTYKCTVDSNQVLCYKQYKIQHNDASAIAKVLDQLIPLIHIDHENLIKYRGIALEYDHILFFMEYCSHGTIAQVLFGTSPSHGDSRRPSSSVVCSIVDTSFVDNGIIQTTAGYAFFLESLARRYLKQLLSALSCLHKNEIIHRDIRNVNIFFTDATRERIKLGDVNFVYDFKFMKKQVSLLDMEAVANIRESIVFYSPETITQNEITTKSDIWSLGCTLVHMLTGRIPWSNPSSASSAYYLKVISWVANGVQPTIPIDFSLSENCIDFLKKCFQHNPNHRLSADELLQHSFVKNEQ